MGLLARSVGAGGAEWRVWQGFCGSAFARDSAPVGPVVAAGRGLADAGDLRLLEQKVERLRPARAEVATAEGERLRPCSYLGVEGKPVVDPVVHRTGADQ